MLGLRTKILFGFGGLLLIFLSASLLAETVISRYTATLRRAFKEDYASVEVCQRMKEAVERIDVALREELRLPTSTPPDLRGPEDQFERDLQTQRAAATLAGEKEATDTLARLWSDYKARLPSLSGPSTSRASRLRRRDLYQRDLYPRSLELRAQAQSIIDMNMASMLSVHRKVADTGARATWAVRTLMLSAGALAVVFSVLIGRFILRPLRLLTQTVRQIEQGNLDLVVPFHSGDELGALATATSAMAAQLREYRRRDRERLMRTERTTQLAIDSLPDAVAVVTPGGVIELANNAAKRLFGLSPGVDVKSLPAPWLADLHRRILDTGHASDLNGYESTIEIREDGSTVTPGADEGQESRAGRDARDARGPRRFFLPRTVPILDEGRRPIGATIVLADVTGLRRLDETKNGLLSLVSHELKTPLTSNRMILHLVAGLKVGPLTPRQQELLATARDDADRLHRIVENLLDMSRIESGKALMEFAPADPARLAAESAEALRPAFDGQKVALEVRVPQGLPRVRADAVRVGHVLSNLLNNALRHTPAGGRVRVTAAAETSAVEFAVADDGEGVPRQYAHRIFEKFFRVPGQPGTGGSGLGLSLSKDIIEAHGGRVRAEPAQPAGGRGTVIRFTLPLAEAATTPEVPGRRQDAHVESDNEVSPRDPAKDDH